MTDNLAEVLKAQAAILHARGRKANDAVRHRDKLVSKLTPRERVQLRIVTATLAHIC